MSFILYKSNSNHKGSESRYLSVLLVVARVLLGIVFVFSGFVKSIDPLGSTYKFEDYFHAFGGIFNALDWLAFPAAIALSTFELMLGLNLIFKINLKLTSIFVFVFMLVMTPLTLFIALKNPVSDCGCFGDALVMSNWATFYKNVIFLSLSIFLLIFKNKIRPFLMPYAEWIAIIVFVFVGLGLSGYCYRHLPLIDFRPYKVGTNILKAMQIPANAPVDKYQTTFIYQKNGVQKEFNLENYPKNDSTWKFVDQKSVLISQGFRPAIHDFSIIDTQYNDITNQIISNKGSTYLLLMYDVSKASEKGAEKAEAIYQKTLRNGSKFYAITASTDADIQQFVLKTKITYPFCKADPITLKTIIRANPGLVLIKNGTIQGKWNWRDF